MAIDHSHSLRQLRSLAYWLTGQEPKLLDDFHYSEAIEIIFRDESSDAVPAELDDETTGRALVSPLFIQEGEEPVF